MLTFQHLTILTLNIEIGLGGLVSFAFQKDTTNSIEKKGVQNRFVISVVTIMQNLSQSSVTKSSNNISLIHGRHWIDQYFLKLVVHSSMIQIWQRVFWKTLDFENFDVF